MLNYRSTGQVFDCFDILIQRQFFKSSAGTLSKSRQRQQPLDFGDEQVSFSHFCMAKYLFLPQIANRTRNIYSSSK